MEPTLSKVNVTRAVLALFCLAAAGCQYLPPLPDRPRDVFDSPLIARGHLVSAEQLTQITPGVTARADVQALLGSPSHTATFNDDTWYYISSSSRLRPGRALAISNQRVVTVAFNPNGTVKEVRELGQNDGQSVSFVSRETPVPGNERTLLQGLFGNIGRFNPGGTGGSQQATQPGGTGSNAAPR